MKRRIMIGLNEMVEEGEKEMYAVELASFLKVTGVETFIYADKVLENQVTKKANERNIKMTDRFHEGVGTLKGEFLAYVALDDWAVDNVPLNLDFEKQMKAGTEKSAAITAEEIIKRIKNERNITAEGTSEDRKPARKRKG